MTTPENTSPEWPHRTIEVTIEVRVHRVTNGRKVGSRKANLGPYHPISERAGAIIAVENAMDALVRQEMDRPPGVKARAGRKLKQAELPLTADDVAEQPQDADQLAEQPQDADQKEDGQ